MKPRVVGQAVKTRFADRGAVAEGLVQGYLEDWQARDSRHEFNRLVDTKAARRIIKAAAADFEWFAWPLGTYAAHGLIEVKETQHEYRLDRDRITQLARLRKRQKCGGSCCVLVYHSTLNLWRVLTVERMVKDGGPGGSWDLRDMECLPLDATLAAFHPAFSKVPK